MISHWYVAQTKTRFGATQKTLQAATMNLGATGFYNAARWEWLAFLDLHSLSFSHSKEVSKFLTTSPHQLLMPNSINGRRKHWSLNWTGSLKACLFTVEISSRPVWSKFAKASSTYDAALRSFSAKVSYREDDCCHANNKERLGPRSATWPRRPRRWIRNPKARAQSTIFHGSRLWGWTGTTWSTGTWQSFGLQATTCLQSQYVSTITGILALIYRIYTLYFCV